MTDPRALIAPALAAAGIACFVAAALCSRPAHGAEPAYQIVLFQAPQANEQPDQQRIFVISEAYATKDECLQVLRSVRIKAPKAKARCLPKED